MAKLRINHYKVCVIYNCRLLKQQINANELGLENKQKEEILKNEK